MTLPAEIQQKVDEMLKDVRAHPEHESNWRARKAIYDAMENNYLRVRSWLAILAAEKTLPIYTAKHSDDPLPSILVKLSKKVFEGKVSPISNRMSRVNEYAVSTHRWSQFWNADTAAFTAYKTFQEIVTLNYLPFEHLKSIEIGYSEKSKNGEAFTDSEMSYTFVIGDTAANASVAYSTDEDGIVSLEKRLEFWEWWLTEAIPQAWKKRKRLNLLPKQFTRLA